MELGAFSISLNVKDLAVSQAFYEKLGFKAAGGSKEHHYLIMTNGGTVIGLFQGMFEKNLLTFNPGWTGPHAPVDGPFTDVREIAARLTQAGIELTTRELPADGGPAHITLEDPDGNPILIDQHRGQ